VSRRTARPAPRPRAPAAWRVAATSVRGTSHAAAGAPCQDAHAWAIEGGLLLVAVADGAGTAPLAERGAEVAAGASVSSLRAAAASGGIQSVDGAGAALAEAFARALAAVEARAGEMGADVRDLAATLTVAMVAPGWVAAAQVGDGAVVVRDREGGLHTLAGAESGGEYLNETVFLTSPGVLDALEVKTFDSAPSHVALLTDGLQMLALKLPGREPHLPFFEPLFGFAGAQHDPDAAAERLAAFLAGPRVSARTDDDLTLVLAAVNPSCREAL
jgi:hypothetical protein